MFAFRLLNEYHVNVYDNFEPVKLLYLFTTKKKHNFISLCPFFIYGIRENSSSVPAKGKKSKNVKSEGAHHVPHRKFQLSYGILIM